MAYKEQHPSTVRVFVGKSVDRKLRPGELASDGNAIGAASIPDGSVLTETDTGLQFVWHEDRWHPVRHPLDGLLKQLLAESKRQAESLERIEKELKEQKNGT